MNTVVRERSLTVACVQKADDHCERCAAYVNGRSMSGFIGGDHDVMCRTFVAWDLRRSRTEFGNFDR